jgi:hypothetical protein
MGQYHFPVNLDKKQYLNAHDFGDGLKLHEFGCSADGTLTALTYLLAPCAGRGGGDWEPGKLAGSWAGDRIAIIGDYAEPKDIPGFDAKLIAAQLLETYENVSAAVRADAPALFGRGGL